MSQAKKPGRKKKSLNSSEFNELLSYSNTLSVTERVRLMKSIAGQLGYTCVNLSTNVLHGNTRAVNDPQRGRGSAKDHVRANPLKNTVFEVDLLAAKEAVKKEKERLGLDKLPQDNPLFVQYEQTLLAYKAEKTKLAPLVDQISTNKKKRDRSPVPSSNIVGAEPTPMDVDSTSNKKDETPSKRSSAVKDLVNKFMPGGGKNNNSDSSSVSSLKKQ